VVDTHLPQRVGILGARSMVGSSLLPMLSRDGLKVTAFTRRARKRSSDTASQVQWRELPADTQPIEPHDDPIPFWICMAPISVLPNYFGLLQAHGVRRVVALSSTSRFTKGNSTDLSEQAMAQGLVDAEERIGAWAREHGVQWVVLRPTLIYGLGLDRNICEIAAIIRRVHMFPLPGKAGGLRQPVHCDDVAAACRSALRAPDAANRAYNISGAETLTYRDMVTRVFVAMDKKPRLLSIPLWSFRLGIALLRPIPRFRKWSPAMAERMAQDLVFDHADATRDLAFSPRPFHPTLQDVRRG